MTSISLPTSPATPLKEFLNTLMTAPSRCKGSVFFSEAASIPTNIFHAVSVALGLDKTTPAISIEKVDLCTAHAITYCRSPTIPRNYAPYFEETAFYIHTDQFMVINRQSSEIYTLNFEVVNPHVNATSDSRLTLSHFSLVSTDRGLRGEPLSTVWDKPPLIIAKPYTCYFSVAEEFIRLIERMEYTRYVSITEIDRWMSTETNPRVMPVGLPDLILSYLDIRKDCRSLWAPLGDVQKLSKATASKSNKKCAIQ